MCSTVEMASGIGLGCFGFGFGFGLRSAADFRKNERHDDNKQATSVFHLNIS